MSGHVGVVGLGTMGGNLALNLVDQGFRVSGWQRHYEKARAFAEAHGGGMLHVERTLADLVARLEEPRCLILMVPAGAPVDEVLGRLEALCAAGDVIVDGGNSLWRDTERRQAALAPRLRYVGMGVSGGEEGARHGPSLMPGGEREAWDVLRPVLEAIAARTDSGPCVTHVGPGGAGHYVKMVHNGIEYAVMQLLAEAHDLLRRGMGVPSLEQAALFGRWNEGPLESFLVDISARVLAVRDEGGGALVDQVLDRAGQKGTGRWTVLDAVERGVAVPTIAAGLDARVLSSQKAEREAAGARLPGPGAAPLEASEERLARLEAALRAALAIAFAQGFALIGAASAEQGWGVNRAEVARIWTGGCILRARFLADVRAAFERDAGLANLLVDPAVAAALTECLPALRAVVAEAAGQGVPVPALAASLAYVDAYRSAELPQSLVQAQRDAFGAHGYVRRDDPEGAAVHTDWLAE